MPFDTIETARVKSTSSGSAGDLRATLDHCPEDEISGCTVHQPLGLDARPRGGKADCLYTGNGDVCEVLNMQDVGACKALENKAGAKAEGETRLLSTGADPQAVSVKDDLIHIGQGGDQGIKVDTSGAQPTILIGISATRGGARLNDEVDLGQISFVIDPAVPPGKPAGTLTISYTDGLGNVNPPPPAIFTMTITGLTTLMLAPVFRLRGKIVTASDLVKVE